MSRRGNCFDNAPIDSFWGTLKSELVYHRRFATREEARRAISEYIELFYNRQRTQARLDYLSPVAFTQRYYLNQFAAQPVGVHAFRPTSTIYRRRMLNDNYRRTHSTDDNYQRQPRGSRECEATPTGVTTMRN